MTTNANWLLPRWHQEWNILTNNWLAEDNTAENITNSAIWRAPHFLQFELLDTILVGGNGCAFDGDIVLLSRQGRVNCYLGWTIFIIQIFSLFINGLIFT